MIEAFAEIELSIKSATAAGVVYPIALVDHINVAASGGKVTDSIIDSKYFLFSLTNYTRFYSEAFE